MLLVQRKRLQRSRWSILKVRCLTGNQIPKVPFTIK